MNLNLNLNLNFSKSDKIGVTILLINEAKASTGSFSIRLAHCTFLRLRRKREGGTLNQKCIYSAFV